MRRRDDYLKHLIGKRVVLTSTSDDSIRGVVAVVGADTIVLEAPEYLGKATDPAEMTGRAGMLRANLSFWQEL